MIAELFGPCFAPFFPWKTSHTSMHFSFSVQENFGIIFHFCISVLYLVPWIEKLLNGLQEGKKKYEQKNKYRYRWEHVKIPGTGRIANEWQNATTKPFLAGSIVVANVAELKW